MQYKLELNDGEITEYQSWEDVKEIPEGKLAKELIEDGLIQISFKNLFAEISECPQGNKYKAKVDIKIERVE